MKKYANYKDEEQGGSGKFLYSFLCMVLITAACAAMFFLVWRNFVTHNNHTGYLTGTGNLLMSLTIYTALLVFALHNLGGYKVQLLTETQIIASQAVALFVVDMCEVLISMAVTGQFRYAFALLWRYLCLFGGQWFVAGVLSIPMVRLYRRLFPPFLVLEIYGREQNRLDAKINARPDKFRICRGLNLNRDETRILAKIRKYDAILLNDVPAALKNRLLKSCFEQGKRVYLVPKISDIIIRSSKSLSLFDTPLYFCRNIGLTRLQRFWKRCFDLGSSTVALLVLSPFFVLVALAIKLDDGGPVFYTQERTTLGGRRFRIVKFRSMIVNAEQDGRSRPAGEHDDRITRVGRLLRASRMDELPQLFNIVRGEMSVVGPRPERIEHVEKYSSLIPEFRFREKVKGGLTGYAQVYGKYNTSALDKLKFDLMYIMNYSFLLDIQIILETVKILFSKESTEGFSAEQRHQITHFGGADKKAT